MAQKYTPGPWHVGMQPGPIVYGPGGAQIADCRSISHERAENGYNARLIAEVPAMLAIIQSLASPGINHGASRELLARLGEG